MAGVGKSYVTPVDWDYDGVLDLLVTHEYGKKSHNPVEFFRGINTDKGLRFAKKQPLFVDADGKKALPGCQPMISVTDFNGDGLADLATANSTSNDVSILPGIGDGTFVAQQRFG